MALAPTPLSRQQTGMSIPTEYPFDFDPTYGMTLADLQAIRPPEAPEGFDAFWQKRYISALAVKPEPRLNPVKDSHPDWQLRDIVYTSTDDISIGGWLLTPREGEIKRGLVVGHGYGGRDEPEFDLPVEETAILFPCFRGMSRSAHPPIPSDAPGHVLHEIEDPEHYVIGGCVEDLWVAVSTLLSLYPQLDGHIGYSGISFGGGIGALGVPFDRRIQRAHLTVPTFGNRKLWLTLPTVGSAHSAQDYAKTHSDVFEKLRLFDAATAASRITVPMLAAVALFDPAVAPPCQFAVANALPTSKFNEIFILDAGHFDYPDSAVQQTALRGRVGRFFRGL
jgi:cephalosporin-C deacetylase